MTHGFVRPHEFELSRLLPSAGRALLATIEHVSAAGPQVRLEVKVRGNKNLVAAEVSKTQYRDLELSEGAEVFLTPQNTRVFNNSEAAGQLLEQRAGI
jgi:ABC-type sulfate/molybdate transport systems ATPase subunit